MRVKAFVCESVVCAKVSVCKSIGVWKGLWAKLFVKTSVCVNVFVCMRLYVNVKAYVCVILSLCKRTVVCKACLYVWACLYVEMSVSILLPVSPSSCRSFIPPSISSHVPTFHNMSAPCLFILGIIVYLYIHIFVSCYKIFPLTMFLSALGPSVV